LRKRSKSNPSFNRILLKAIDEALSALGESPKKAIYYHLKITYSIKKHEIPCRIEEFEEAIGKIFGLGARCLELLFMRSLYAKIGAICDWSASDWVSPEVTFIEYVHLMKQNFEKQGTNETKMEVLINANEEQEQYT
jgi:hypothetical protein